MGRLQVKGKGKGISDSALPFKRRTPKWTVISPQATVNLAVKLARKGMRLMNLFRIFSLIIYSKLFFYHSPIIS